MEEHSPVLLLTTHKRPASIILDLSDIVSIPIERRDRPIVVPSIKHNQINKLAQREATPDSEIVIHVDLADGHPLEVSTHSVHLPLVDANAAVVDERLFSVVQAGAAVSVAVVADLEVSKLAYGLSQRDGAMYFVIVPHWDVGELLVRKQQVGIGAVGGKTSAVIVESEDFALRLDRTRSGGSGVLVDIVTELQCVSLPAQQHGRLRSHG